MLLRREEYLLITQLMRIILELINMKIRHIIPSYPIQMSLRDFKTRKTINTIIIVWVIRITPLNLLALFLNYSKNLIIRVRDLLEFP